MNHRPIFFVLAVILALSLSCLSCLPVACAADSAGAADSVEDIQVTVTIPDRKEGVFAPDKLVAGGSVEGVRIVFENSGTDVATVAATIAVPDLLSVSVPTQELSERISAHDNTVAVEIGEIASGESVAVRIRVKPPDSIPMKTNEEFLVSVTAADGSGTEYKHRVTIIPPPSWITYGTIIVSLVLVAIVLFAVSRFGILEMFTTIDLVTIALLAALAGVVFRWFWQTFNDLLGPFGGLIFTIPVSALLVIALHLVRKPGTATLLFLVDQMVCMVIWGSNITVWLGWYLLEGAVVDAEVALFGGNYADTRVASVIYGMSRGFISYWLFYFLFSPAAWKICYADWYAWLQVGLAVLGGLIGGSIGYDAARKMRSAMM